MTKNINMPQQAQSSQTIANKGNNNMNIANKERIETIKKEICNSIPYLNSCILPQLERLTDNEHDLSLLGEFAKGSYLIYSPAIQTYTVINHCYHAGLGNLYVIAETKTSMYGFFLDINGFVRLGTFDKKNFQKNLLKNSTYVGKTVAEIAHEFSIPYVEQIPSLYVPYPHTKIEQIIKDSYEYVNDCIMPRFTKVSKDSDEWWFLYDFCQGSILVNAPSVLNLTIKGHFQDGNGTDYFVIQNYNDISHYFVLHHGKNHDYIRYAYARCETLKQCANSPFIGKELREIAKTYHIPFLYELPEIFGCSDDICHYMR